MKLSRLFTTLAATIGLALAFVYFAGDAFARTTLEPPADDTGQLFTPPPPAVSTTVGTSVWWFVLVVAATVVATVVIMLAARALRGRRMLPTTG
jgi:hypothetical protein